MRTFFRLLIVLGVFFYAPAALAQSAPGASVKYWVFFKSDPGSSSPLPEAMEEAAVQRRALRGSAGAAVLDRPVSEATLERLRAAGVEPLVVSRWLRAASAVLLPEERAAVEGLPFVDAVVPVGRVDPATSAKMPDEAPVGAWSMVAASPDDINPGYARRQLDLMNDVGPLAEGINGTGVRLGFLDTSFNEFNHPVFDKMKAEDRLLAVRNFTGKEQTSYHGFWVASIAVGYQANVFAGPAYGASVLAATTEYAPSETNQEEDYFVAGLEWLEAQGADVVNVSLGYTEFDPGERSYTRADINGRTAITSRAVAAAASRGVVIVASAGNEGCAAPSDGCWFYIGTPGDADSILTVGAVGPDSTRAFFSSRGPTVDGRIKPEVAALGSGVVAAQAGGGYWMGDGTSFSAPLVSGVVAQLLQVNPTLKPMDVRQILLSTASQSAAPDNDLGWGIVNAAEAIRMARARLQTETPDEDLAGPSAVAVPNPCLSDCALFVHLPQAAQVTISVYDLLGRPVGESFRGLLAPGARVDLPALAAAPSGIYFFSLRTGDAVKLGKVAHIR